MHVSVVKAYAPVSECASVTLEMSVDFPPRETDQGHRGVARLADLEALARTGAPRRGRGLFLLEFELGILAFNFPMWAFVALFFWVL